MRIGTLLACALVGALAVGTATRGPAQSAAPDRDLAKVVFPRGAPAAEMERRAAALRAKARARGFISVIVGLDFRFQPEDSLSPAEAERQSQALRRLQDAVLQSALGPQLHGRIFALFEAIPYLMIRVSPSELDTLLTDPRVVNIHEDFALRPLLSDSVEIIEAPKLWDMGSPGRGRVIAVIDTGVDAAHPMLREKIVSEACYSGGGDPEKSLCPDGSTESTAPGSARYCRGCGSHGTSVASIAVGKSARLKGVAQSARLLPIVAASRGLEFITSDVIKALERVYRLRDDYQVAAINLSIGLNEHYTVRGCNRLAPALTAMVEKLRDAGIVTFAASGNEGETASSEGATDWPACVGEVVAVGATTKSDELWKLSDHDDKVGMLAPGADIEAAIPGNRYRLLSGTSFAAPHAAGAQALLRNALPGKRPNELVAALECSGFPVRREHPDVPDVPWKNRISVYDAYRYLLSTPRPEYYWRFFFPRIAKPWEPLVGRWEVRQRRYHLTEAEEPSGFSIQSTFFPDCHDSVNFSVSMRLVTLADDGPQRLALFHKARVNERKRTVSGYMFWYARSETGLGGTIFIYRLDDFPVGHQSASRAGTTILCSKRNDTLPRNTYLTFKVLSRGGAHVFYINGDKVCEAIDFTYPAGWVGIGVQQVDGWDFATESFDVKWARLSSVVPNSREDHELAKIARRGRIIDPAADVATRARWPLAEVSR
jgi:subtilisin family serine protease